MTYTLGLDLGTSFSSISYLNPKTGLPEIIKIDGWEQTPTIVFYGEKEEDILVGRSASNRLEEADENDTKTFQATFKSFKRDLNTPIHPLPYGNRTVRPVDIVADFIRYMKKYAEEHCFNEIDSVTNLRLTYPIAFKGIEKKILKGAAILAGFEEENVEMLFEPVAAALGYAATGFNLGRNILVYDLGGGTFDLSLVHRQDNGTIEPSLEPVGVTGCAGDDFDLAIYKHWEGQLLSEHHIRFHQKEGKVNNQVLLECRKAKEKLSDQTEARYAKYFEKEGFHFKAEKLRREEFEHLIAPLVDRQIDLTRDMLRQAKSENIEVDTLLLIGSATYTPLVRSELEKLFQEEELPLTLTKTMHAGTAVALGAVVDRTSSISSGPDDSLRLLALAKQEEGQSEQTLQELSKQQSENDDDNEDWDEEFEDDDDWDEDDKAATKETLGQKAGQFIDGVVGFVKSLSGKPKNKNSDDDEDWDEDDEEEDWDEEDDDEDEDWNEEDDDEDEDWDDEYDEDEEEWEEDDEEWEEVDDEDDDWEDEE